MIVAPLNNAEAAKQLCISTRRLNTLVYAGLISAVQLGTRFYFQPRWLSEFSLMTGDDLYTLRNDLGLSAVALAGILGVAPSTISRWEKRGLEKADPSSLRVLMLLHEYLPREERKDAGKKALEGGVRGLYALLHSIYQDKPLFKNLKRNIK